MSGELEFPEAIIQRIQSLLTGKEAARTTILSKSWHIAWLTRPNLELNESRFKYGFCEYAKQTIKRYQQSNLKIERFELQMENNCCRDKAAKLIVTALTKLGATRLILEIKKGNFFLPCEAVFGADNLVELSVKGCQMNLDGIAIKCCRLESLSLYNKDIDIDAVYNIISSCPLIEKLSLFNYYYCRFREQKRGLNLERLRCLVLCYASFEAFFPGDLLSKFPLLKDFTLLDLNPSCFLRSEDGIDVKISNCSLEHIKIVLEKSIGYRPDDKKLKVKLDVPNIRKFTFECGDVFPELCFASSSSTTGEWESHVSIAHYGDVSLLWFRGLNEFLTQLRQSKIHLSLFVKSVHTCCDYRFGDLSVTRKLELESLTMDLTSLPPFHCYALLDGLFRLCRPKLITRRIQKKERVEEEFPEWKANIDLLWDAFEQGKHVSVPRQLMYGLKDLEDVNAQIFEDGVWKPLLFEEQADQQRIRFLLKWKPS